jgi:SOS-response transcriptional repressor LexA
MNIGELLARAADRAGKTKAELARATQIDDGTIGDLFGGKVDNPEWQTVFKLVTEIETTWGDLFEETRLPLSPDDAVVAAKFKEVLDRLLANDELLKELARRKSVRPPRKPRKTKPMEIRDAGELKGGVDEVEYLPHQHISGDYSFFGARRAYRVLTDAMARAAIDEGSIIFVGRPSQDLDAADGQIAVVDLNGTLLLKRIDRRGKQTELISEHPLYDEIRVVRDRSIKSVSIVVNVPP